MTVHACNFCFRPLWFLQGWKVTDETVFQKGFQEGTIARNYRLVCSIPVQDTFTRFLIKNKIRGHMNNYDIGQRST